MIIPTAYKDPNARILSHYDRQTNAKLVILSWPDYSMALMQGYPKRLYGQKYGPVCTVPNGQLLRKYSKF